MTSTPHLEALGKETGRHVQVILAASKAATDAMIWPEISDAPDLEALREGLQSAADMVDVFMGYEWDAARAEASVAKVDAEVLEHLTRWQERDGLAASALEVDF